MTSFEQKYSEYKDLFEKFLKNKLQEKKSSVSVHSKNQFSVLKDLESSFQSEDASQKYSDQILNFYKSIEYSLAGEGKRFRPVLALSVSDLLGGKHQDVLPLALAIEMIHTYSLIHDDLPCMDNDDFRRGSPTNHKVYGEATALLAGDALLTEAFSVLVESPREIPRLVQLVSACAGTSGMIGGQVVDLATQTKMVTAAELVQVQHNKTGALMRASIVGAAIVCEANQRQIHLLEEFATLIGLSFQVADDILDQGKNETGSFVSVLGLEKTQALLANLTHRGKECLSQFGSSSEFLINLAEYNYRRLK